MIELIDKKLKVDGLEWELDYRVQDAFESGSNVIVLFDPSGDALKIQNFKNLVCYSKNKELLWIADLPTDKPADTYCGISSRDPLKLYSFCSYTVRIDPSSGEIIEKTFTK